jgi:hypothetical protein
MKINTAAAGKVNNSGSIETGVATLELNAVIAHVLSRDLYTRPVEAAIREVTINALDAHRESGVTVPVQIHVPTWREPFFAVRDFGAGMSHEEVMKIYLDYGVSTRRGSNDVHGGLGLGTKAPLAYTDSFSVTSFNGGEKREYLIYYNEDGLPTRDLRTVTPTSERGLEVKFALKHNNDIGDFYNAATKILPWIPAEAFATNIELTGARYDDLDIQVFGKLGLRHGRGIEVVMGYQRYDVPAPQLFAALEKLDLSVRINGNPLGVTGVFKHISDKRLVTLFGHIGDVQVHPSRESVVLTRAGAQNLAYLFADGLQVLAAGGDAPSFVYDVSAAAMFGSPVIATKPELHEAKIRARVLGAHNWRHSKMAASELLDTYADLVKMVTERRHQGKLHWASLSQFDFTDYFAKAKSFEYPPPGELSHEDLLIVVDEGNCDPLALAALEPVQKVDITANVATFRRDMAEEQRKQSMYNYRRTVVRSMKDPSHNVLRLKLPGFYLGAEQSHRYKSLGTTVNAQAGEEYDHGAWEGCYGTRKDHWSSFSAEPADLEGLVYWTPTRMGCSEDRRLVAQIVWMLSAISGTIVPDETLPTIIGLPASKGTKRFEKAFQPLEDIHEWIDEVMSRPSSIRLMNAHHISTIIDQLNIIRPSRWENLGLNELAPFRTVRQYQALVTESESQEASFHLMPPELLAYGDPVVIDKAIKDLTAAIVMAPLLSDMASTVMEHGRHRSMFAQTPTWGKNVGNSDYFALLQDWAGRLKMPA